MKTADGFIESLTQHLGMSQAHAVALSDEEIDSLLGTGGVGVISFADGDTPYSIPVSYGYDSEKKGLYVRFGFGPDSEKRRYIDDAVTASLVITDETVGGWRSVVARGPLTKIIEPALDSHAAESVREVNIPFVTIYEQQPSTLEFELYRLDPDELSGRKER